MIETSSLGAEAAQLHDAYQLDELPIPLRRNSLRFYYLSVYPSIKDLRPLAPGAFAYPDVVKTLYLHVPFCSGACSFCNYYFVPVRKRTADDATAAYLELLKREIDFHLRHTRLAVSSLYFGGGTPSLIPPAALAAFFRFLDQRGVLDRERIGTIELHPELFDDPVRANEFLRVARGGGIDRVSIGYQASENVILDATNRRHGADFLAHALDTVRRFGFRVNIDLMYGLPGQSLASWERTLADALARLPDSVSVYFLSVAKWTAMHRAILSGREQLPGHRHLQTQHLMAQLALERHGFHELPNDFFAAPSGPISNYRQESLPGDARMLPIGAGAYGFCSGMQFCNYFDRDRYRTEILADRSPLWRGYRLNADEMLHRDVMFSWKNAPHLDRSLFQARHGCDPVTRFPRHFDVLVQHELIGCNAERVWLTPKGRLCVEEIASLFCSPTIPTTERFASRDEQVQLEKHTFASSYGTL